MRKISVLQTGGPDVLQLGSTVSPTPVRHEVLVDVEAAGVNYVDVLQRVGHSEVARPYTPGLESVGVVSEVGPGVTQMKVGTRVAWINRLGSYAEQIVLPVEQAVLVPNSFGISESMLLQGVTAQYLLAEYRDIRPGDVVLVHSAARVAGATLFEYVRDPREMQSRALAVIQAIQQGWLRMAPTTNFPLEQASAAHRAIESRNTQGKLVLVPGR
jgi:NADPH:quinone reductase